MTTEQFSPSSEQENTEELQPPMKFAIERAIKSRKPRTRINIAPPSGQGQQVTKRTKLRLPSSSSATVNPGIPATFRLELFLNDPNRSKNWWKR